MSDTPWTGQQNGKAYLTSGQFSSTIKDSLYCLTWDGSPSGVSWDSVNSPWCGRGDDKLYLGSGQFTSTLKTSEYVGGIDIDPVGISYDGTDTPWVGDAANKLYLQSGQFTSTLKTSEWIQILETVPGDISADATNTPWAGNNSRILYLQSGRFTSTVKASEDVSGIDTAPCGISWDGVNTLWDGGESDKLFLQSGQFTSTLKTSQYVGDTDVAPVAISTNDYDGRLGGGEEFFVNASDTIVVSDAANFIAVYVVVASDTLSLSDEVIRVHEVLASDTVVISDAAGFIATYVVTASDTFSLSDEGIQVVDEAYPLNLTYYGTLEEADEYFGKRFHEWAWSAASTKNKKRALIETRRLMDGLCYKGYKHTVYEVMQQWEEGAEIDDDKLAEIRAAEAAQLNEFPRGADVEVPEDILIAQYEIAHSLLDNKDPELELEILAVTSATYGGVKTMYQREQLPLEHLINMIPNAVAWRRIRPYLRDGDAIKLSRVS